MKQFLTQLKEYLILIRIRFWIYTVTLPVSSMLAMGSTQMRNLIRLVIIGSLYHILGHTMNDYLDLKFDKYSLNIFKKPLARGAISKRAALSLIFGSLILFFLTTWFFFPKLIMILTAAAAVLFGSFYNLWSKKILGSDIFLAFSIFFFSLLGALSVDINLTLTACFISLFWGLDWLYATSLQHLRDLNFDRRAGARTFPLHLGVTLKDSRLRLTNSYKLAISTIRILDLIIFGYLLIFSPFSLSLVQSPLLLLFILLTCCGVIFLHLRLIWPEETEPRKHSTSGPAGVVLGWIIIFFILSPVTGLEVTISLFFISLAWGVFFNRFLFGRSILLKRELQ